MHQGSGYRWDSCSLFSPSWVGCGPVDAGGANPHFGRDMSINAAGPWWRATTGQAAATAITAARGVVPGIRPTQPVEGTFKCPTQWNAWGQTSLGEWAGKSRQGRSNSGGPTVCKCWWWVNYSGGPWRSGCVKMWLVQIVLDPPMNPIPVRNLERLTLVLADNPDLALRTLGWFWIISLCTLL